MSRLIATDDPATAWGTFERIRLSAAMELDRVTDSGRRAGEAYPEGGMVARLAADLGTDVETLFAWSAAQNNAM